MLHPFIASLRFITAALLSIGVPACATPDPNDETPRELPCNLLDDDACAALPGAAEALALLDSMDVDLNEVQVELVELPDNIGDEAPADAPTNPDRLESVEPPPQEQRVSCNNNGEYNCCCYWDGPKWGCGCV